MDYSILGQRPVKEDRNNCGPNSLYSKISLHSKTSTGRVAEIYVQVCTSTSYNRVKAEWNTTLCTLTWPVEHMHTYIRSTYRTMRLTMTNGWPLEWPATGIFKMTMGLSNKHLIIKLRCHVKDVTKPIIKYNCKQIEVTLKDITHGTKWEKN